MRSGFSLIFAACAIFMMFATVAQADTPAFLEGATLEAACAPIRADLKCPTCTCEPYTQSNPTKRWTKKATPIVTATLVMVTGKTSDNHINALYVVLGTETALYLGGKVFDLGVPLRIYSKSTYKIVQSKQHYDMCPGACEHNPVGAVHLFELSVTIDEKTDSDPKHERLQSHATHIVSCYMKDDKEPVECFDTGLAYESRLFYPAKKRQAKFKGWKRTWSLGGPLGMRFKVGKITGKDAKSARKEAVGQAPAISQFRDLGKRSDTVLITEKGQGVRIAVPVKVQ